jgi:hypothetical protein
MVFIAATASALPTEHSPNLARLHQSQNPELFSSRPGILERFLAPSEGADAVRDTWVSMWSLDKDDGKGAEEAVRRTHVLVLKPQREGGGNNVYQGNTPPFVV